MAAPRRIVVANGWKPYALVSIPIAVFVPWQLDLGPLAGFMVLVGTLIAVAYASVLHFFASEVFLRPVVREAATHLPNDFGGAYIGVPLRWRLLAALPIINVITGVVVSGLNSDGATSLTDMGVDVVVAVLVAFTVSLELTVLVTRSVMRPVDDLIEATERVKEGPARHPREAHLRRRAGTCWRGASTRCWPGSPSAMRCATPSAATSTPTWPSA